MNRKIENYSFVWNTEANQGQIIFQLAKVKDRAGSAPLLLDSASEGMLVLDILRNEKPVYFDDENNLILTGFDVSEPKKKTTKAKPKAKTKK